MTILDKWALDDRIGDWTVSDLLTFVQEVRRKGITPPRIGYGVSLREHMKDASLWEDDRPVEEIIRGIYEARTVGRDIEL